MFEPFSVDSDRARFRTVRLVSLLIGASSAAWDPISSAVEPDCAFAQRHAAPVRRRTEVVRYGHFPGRGFERMIGEVSS
jgi:hypothetical protein